MGKINFIHLHVHSQYSILDSLCKIETLIGKCQEYKMPALAITDHGNLFGAIEFYTKCLDAGIKPIIGCEMYIAPHSRFDRNSEEKNFHIILLVANQEGYQNLIQLSSASYLEGFYFKPRIDYELLEKYHSGLIALSGCLQGEIQRSLLAGNEKEAEQAAGRLSELFGKNNFYLELQANEMEEQNVVNSGLLRLAKKLNLPVIATNDCHYISRDDSQAHDVLLCIQTGKKINDPDRLKFSGNGFYFKSGAEMKEYFKDIPQAIENTIAVAEMCNLELKFNEVHLPTFTPPEGHTADSYLRELVYKGAEKRGLQLTEEIIKRLEKELTVIQQTGFSSYFLIVHDLVEFAKSKGIPVGPGRGSAAGSMVAYCLGITNINPMEYGLLFERFLNIERKSLPDIDIDFCRLRRSEIIDYVTQKYGSESVGKIITFATMEAKCAVRDVGRVLGVPLEEVNRVAKLIPNEQHITLERALEISYELREYINKSDRLKEMFNIARKLQGTKRQMSVHAAGIVIAPTKLTDYLPLCKSSTKQEITTQYDMNSIEKIGLLKIDFLGLRTLTVITDTISKIEKRYGIKLDKFSLDDQAVYQMLSKGETIGIFQLEKSSSMSELVKKVAPEKFEDLIAVLALHRPGPLSSGMLEEFVQRKRGLKPIEYLHPALEPILKSTYGVILYQEQVMEIASALAGFSLSQADILRRAMGKKKKDEMMRLREDFVMGAARNGVEKQLAEQIFELLSNFASYGFNKSHSAAYALISYQSAYLKKHFPVEFMASLLNSEIGNFDKIALYLNECRKMGIEVLPPDINESGADFTIVEDASGKKKIRVGLETVKHVGRTAVEEILKARQNGPFKSLRDFCNRVDTGIVNSRAIDSLIKSGAFDSFGQSRATLLSNLSKFITEGIRYRKQHATGQTSFLDLGFESEDCRKGSVETAETQVEFTEQQLLQFEKDTLGFFVSTHPLAKYQKTIAHFPLVSSRQINEQIVSDDIVNIVGIITEARPKTSKSGKKLLDLIVEDLEGSILVRVFSSNLEKYSNILYKDNLVYITGRVDFTAEKPTVILSTAEPLEEVVLKLSRSLHILFASKHLSPDLFATTSAKLQSLFKKYKGTCPVYFHLVLEDDGKQKTSVLLRLGENFYVVPKSELLLEISKLQPTYVDSVYFTCEE